MDRFGRRFKRAGGLTLWILSHATSVWPAVAIAVVLWVIVHVRQEELADRRAKGLDRRDEMWEGVLHMTPAPTLESTSASSAT